ncbi:MAG: molybdate ABC transporter substrate-binding protein [Burkholderiales bacterium]|nr:MAG: molybdate ABC transporter substrate-binding protein [Burkholderiales bacterium]
MNHLLRTVLDALLGVLPVVLFCSTLALPGPVLAQPVVFAAASLKEALDAASLVWSRQSGLKPSISYAASSALARQIDQGAPADVFVSADEIWPGWLRERGRLRDGRVVPLLTNRLVLIAPASSPAPVLRLVPGVPLAAALGADGRLAVGEIAAVPAGRYARVALEALGAWSSVSGRLAETENVRVALTLVARGEAPLGIVYATDARAEPRVRVVDTFPEGSHPPIVYPVAIVADARSPHAQGFVDFLRSPAGMAVFAGYGFGPAPR